MSTRARANRLACLISGLLLISSPLLGLSANADQSKKLDKPVCPSGTHFRDDGVSFGCEGRDEDGKPVRVGQWRHRNTDRQVVLEVNHDANGVEHGLLRRWYPPGRNPEAPRKGLAEEMEYRHGERTGLHRRWWPPGAASEEALAGEHQDSALKAEPNLRDEGFYLYGKWHGISAYWNKEGNPSGARCYVCGERADFERCTFDPGNETEFLALCGQLGVDVAEIKDQAKPVDSLTNRTPSGSRGDSTSSRNAQ